MPLGLLANFSAGSRAKSQVDVDFTQKLEFYLRATDIMVGKPGPASIFKSNVAGTHLVPDAAKTMRK